MPLGSVIKNITGLGEQHSFERDESHMVAESLLMELDYQIKEADEALRQQEVEKRKQTMGVDYSWLLNNNHKAYEMPQLERLELEELCTKVRPDESSRVINAFRHGLLREPAIQEYARILRACITQVLDTRAKEETMSEWMRRSLTKLRPSSSRSKIAPISGGGEETDLDESCSSRSSSMFFTKGEHHLPVDDLPV